MVARWIVGFCTLIALVHRLCRSRSVFIGRRCSMGCVCQPAKPGRGHRGREGVRLRLSERARHAGNQRLVRGRIRTGTHPKCAQLQGEPFESRGDLPDLLFSKGDGYSAEAWKPAGIAKLGEAKLEGSGVLRRSKSAI